MEEFPHLLEGRQVPTPRKTSKFQEKVKFYSRGIEVELEKRLFKKERLQCALSAWKWITKALLTSVLIILF